MSQMQFCTISSRAYLPNARLLAEYLRRHQPHARLHVLLVDDLEGEVNPAVEPFLCVRNEEIGLDPAELHRMYLIHGSQFLSAVKIFFIDHLVATSGLPTLCVDSDLIILGALDDLGALIDEHGVLLVPHSISPYPLDGMQPDDTTILSAGVYNAGVMGFGARGRPALSFLKSRLARECVTDPARMRVFEQRWLDYLPSFFPCHILRDPGINAAYWNLHERPLTRVDGRIMAGSAPLRLLHLSGYDPLNPSTLTCYAPNRPRVVLASDPILSELCDQYRAALIGTGYERHRSIPLPFERLPGGIPVDANLRALYLADVLAADAKAGAFPPDGYDPAERAAFVAWAAAAYRGQGVAVPEWVSAAAAVAVAPTSATTTHGGPAPAAPPTTPASASPARVSQPSPVPTEELVRRLAESSVAAIANLDERLSALEQTLARLSAVSVGS